MPKDAKLRSSELPFRALTGACFLFAFGTALADVAWIPMRDENPFVLGVGIPLLPQPAPQAGHIGIDAYIAEGNTQLISSAPGAKVVFAAETRESRISVKYAFNNAWSARVSVGDEWIGVGFLDRPIQHFHNLIGAPRGFRGGRIGVKPPFIEVTENGQVLYKLDQPSQGLAPLLVDFERRWELSGNTTAGVTLSAKFPTGSTKELSDTGNFAQSVSVYWDTEARDYLHVGGRIGYLHQNGGDVLGPLIRPSAAFGDIYARVPLVGRWYGQLQYDVHSGLYRSTPVFLRYSGSFSIGLIRRLKTNSELILGVAEDVPIAHTQDVVFQVALRAH